MVGAGVRAVRSHYPPISRAQGPVPGESGAKRTARADRLLAEQRGFAPATSRPIGDLRTGASSRYFMFFLTR